MSGWCCVPTFASPGEAPVAVGAADVAGGAHRIAQRPLAGGRFVMGDAHDEGLPADGERPRHEVVVGAFAMDETTVTNADFAAFVDATGHRTSAERAGFSAVFHALVDPASDLVIGASGSAPWWWAVAGADWAHPTGPGSGVGDLDDHPVVHVSHTDATAYCTWASRALPTEAQWEYAARGGLVDARYGWGDDRRTPADVDPCRIYDPVFWGSAFPAHPGARVDAVPTVAVDALPPNGFGLRQMSGNVWEWCADRHDPRWYGRSPRHDPIGPDRGAARVLRGGSYLCDDSYCRRYRVAARSHNTPESSSGNTGFRTVAPA